MTTKPIPAPDWFETFWNANLDKIPFYLRNDKGKQLARAAIDAAIQSGAQIATTPQGIRGLIALARITAIVRGVTGVCDAPDPSPEQVAEAVERLMRRPRGC